MPHTEAGTQTGPPRGFFPMLSLFLSRLAAPGLTTFLRSGPLHLLFPLPKRSSPRYRQG